MEINKCYVCLEECQGEQSPCECKTPIHHKCFVNLGDLEQCTICKKQYVTTQVIEEPQEHIIVVRKKTTNPYFGHFNYFNAICKLVFCRNFRESNMGYYWRNSKK